MSILGSKVEQHAPALISRAIAIAMPILVKRADASKVIEEENKHDHDSYISKLALPNGFDALIKVEESDAEVARKVLELVHNVFRNLISAVSSDIKNPYKSLLGVPQLRYSE
jgi:hypothetical protein